MSWEAKRTVVGSSEHQDGADDVRDEEELVPAAADGLDTSDGADKTTYDGSDTPLKVRLAARGRRKVSASLIRRRRGRNGRRAKSEGRIVYSVPIEAFQLTCTLRAATQRP